MHACVMYMYVQVYRADVLYVLVWCIICTGLGVLNWTGLMYVLDWGLAYILYCMRGEKGVKHCMREGGGGKH